MTAAALITSAQYGQDFSDSEPTSTPTPMPFVSATVAFRSASATRSAPEVMLSTVTSPELVVSVRVDWNMPSSSTTVLIESRSKLSTVDSDASARTAWPTRMTRVSVTTM